MHLVALVDGEPASSALYTLRRLAATGHRLTVLRGPGRPQTPRLQRARRIARNFGAGHALSRLVGGVLIGRRADLVTARTHDLLFDAGVLRQWWRAAAVPIVEVPRVNGPETRERLTALAPDLMVRVKGGILRPEVFRVPRLGTLNVHHGIAPTIRGVWSIPWGVLERHGEWIGATVHQIDEDIDTGAVYRHVRPQITPGDDADTLFFRAHLLVVDALLDVIDVFATGQVPPRIDCAGPSTYRTSPGLGEWLRYTLLAGGRRSPFLLEEALR